MGHHHITEVKEEKFEFTSRSRMFVGLVFIVGLILTFVGFSKMKSTNEHGNKHAKVEHVEQNVIHAVANQEGNGEQHGAEHSAAAGNEANREGGEHAGGHHETWKMRFWANLLLNSYYFMLFALAAVFFIAVNYAANAGWSTLLKRVIESISSYLPVAIVILMIVVFMGKDYIYHHWWPKIGLKPGDAGYDALIEKKSWFLSKGWLMVGAPVIMIIWVLFRTILVRFSHKEDVEGGTSFFRKSVNVSAGFLVFFAFTFSILSWILIMSIDAHWYSTIFSVYNFAIAFVTGLTVICFFTLYLKSKGYMEIVSDEVIHDLGKFMFAFSIFWAYIWLAQFLLIWYANISEEGIYYTFRLEHFKPMFRVNILMNFFLPFLILMMRNAKRNPKVLLVAGTIILFGHWLDLFLMIMPGVVGETAHIGLLEIGMTMAFAGLFIYWVLHNLSRKNLYAANHPYLLESANHDVGV
ncbi:MAG: quinol:cytochrome C oxidoreductase [Flavobacteriales bacterium]|nr:quinol:cytochrome C oxidoreductase [Flavobacteriales bacterium]